MAVIILVDDSEYTLKSYKELKQNCENEGIAFINFFKKMTNKKDYVKQRIDSLLKNVK